jgi:hypothetical protein
MLRLNAPTNWMQRSRCVRSSSDLTEKIGIVRDNRGDASICYDVRATLHIFFKLEVGLRFFGSIRKHKVSYCELVMRLS